MLSTKYLVQSAVDVPPAWIFEHYCKLGERLSGQDIKIKSIFNPSEKTPSMCIYFKDGKYLFKDFSTGKGGSAVKMVQEIFNEEWKLACMRVVEDYNQYVLSNNGTAHKLIEFKHRSKFRVVDAIPRQWYSQDKHFWQKFGVSSKLLNEHNVRPLESYRMEKVEDGEVKSLEIKGLYIYGYYTSDNILYKIYQPKVKEYKFIKVENYLQGSEQLKNHKVLVITSSMKDLLVLKSAGLSLDVIAPDSENTIIKEDVIKDLQEKYEKILTLFDNDDAGIAAMKKYKDLYGIDYVYFDLEKDISDAVKAHGQSKVFLKLIPAINKKING